MKTTYLALSKSGHPIASFQTPELGHAFVAKRARQNVTVELVEQTVIQKPCVQRKGGLVASLDDARRRAK